MVDEPLEKLLEELDSARRRLETRLPLIREALDELAHVDSVKLENYLGFGRSLSINDDVRLALHRAADEEIAAMRGEVARLRELVMSRRLALEGLPEA